MRIEFSQDGGLAYLPALSTPVALDVDRLSPGDAEHLKGLVVAARFFDQPASGPPVPAGAADYQHYILTIEDGGRRHTVRMSVPVADPALQELVSTVRKLLKAARAAAAGSVPESG